DSTTCTVATVGATTTSPCAVAYTPSAGGTTHNITASYGGSNVHAASGPSTAFGIAVSSAAATTTAASAAAATYGDNSVNLSATVTSGSTVNQGTVTFTVKNGATTICSPAAATVSSGAASAAC